MQLKGPTSPDQPIGAQPPAAPSTPALAPLERHPSMETDGIAPAPSAGRALAHVDLKALHRAVAIDTGPDPLAVGLTSVPLPKVIVEKTATETFTDKRFYAVRDGRVWEKPRHTADGSEAHWQLVQGTGLPHGKNCNGPAKVTEISSDAAHLIAIGDDNRIYDGRLSDAGLDWHDTWGLPKPKAFSLPENRGWAVSTRLPHTSYTDRQGHLHPEIVGISTFFIMDKSGTTIHYGDPWLPDMSNPLYGPLRGRFIAQKMAAGGSVAMVVNKYGDMYATVADFDINGRNPGWFPLDTYNPDTPNYRRVIDDDPWVKQPKVPGRITDQISVVSTGPNARDRELRVRGVDDAGHGGFFAKPLMGDHWAFVPTTTPVTGPFLDNRATDCSRLELGPDRDTRLNGQVSFRGSSLTAELRQFNPDCSPATLHLRLGQQSFDLPVHFRNVYLKSLTLATVEAPKAMMESQDPDVQRFVKQCLHGNRFHTMQMDVTTGQVALHDDFFRLGVIPIPANVIHPTKMTFPRQ